MQGFGDVLLRPGAAQDLHAWSPGLQRLHQPGQETHLADVGEVKLELGPAGLRVKRIGLAQTLIEQG
ncbi:hypothetical protein D9M70_602450 [compost metagenome]